MKSDRPLRPTFTLPSLTAALLALSITSGLAGNFVMSGNDAAGSNSFTNGTNWTGGAAPALGNTYQTGAFRIRSSNSNIPQVFAGDSLEISAGGNWRNKTTATVTVTNLKLADTAIVELTQPNNTNGAASVGSLAGNITLTSGTAVFMAANSTDSPLHVFTISSTISGSGGLTTGNPALTVGGATAESRGTVILTGDNSYSGNTAATAGTLLVNNTTGSGTGTGTVTVATNGTLGGSGSISGATTIDGKLSPGAGVGKLTFTGGLFLGELAADSLKFELGANTTAGTTYDTITTSTLEIGSLDFTDFQFTNAGGLAPGAYTLISSTTVITGSIGAAAGTVAGYPALLSIQGGKNLILTLSGLADTTAPVWLATYPKVSNVTSSGFDALAATNENGTAYFLVLADGAAAPTSATVIATGTAIPLTANVEASATAIGLMPSTSYDVYFVAQDVIPNLQANPVKVDVTTGVFVPATYELAASDAINTSSFNAGTNWGAGTPAGAANQVPSAGNTYQTGPFRIRTPQVAANFIFTGDSLTISAGGNMRHKTAGVISINNFILADTAIVELTQPNGQTAPGLAKGSLAGNITLTDGTATFMAGNATDGTDHVFTIDSNISGTGGLNTTGSNGTVVLTGNNTYTGATTVNGGTLSLVGGSHKSAIAVDGNAALGFTVGLPTTSTSSVSFNDLSKVRVAFPVEAGTPAQVILMTATGFTGTPVLDPAIPGYTLQITPTQLKLVSGNGPLYNTWAAAWSPADVSNPSGDHDQDGLVNFQEFAYGLNPTSGSSVRPILVLPDKTTGQFTYQRRAATGLTYRIQTSSDLANWLEDVTATAGQAAGPVDGDGNQSVVVTLTGPKPLTEKRLYVRIAAQ